MELKPRFTCLALAVWIFTVPGLRADNLNVSTIAISGRSLDWTEESNTIKWPGGAIYSYYQMGRARVQSDASDYFAPVPWSAAWKNSPSYPALSRHVDTPAATPQLTWASPYYSLAKVDMGSTPKRVQSRNFSSGWARSAVNYSVRVEHSSSTPLDYFVLLQHPKFLLGVQAAYTLQPNGFGGDYLYKNPDAARARAAVDVLVDGLPVWSSESTYMYPEGNASYPWDKRLTSWGNTPVDGGQTKLYLGKLQAGKAVTITFVVRTDTYVDADSCGTAYGGWNSPDEKRCFDLTQTVELPTLPSGPVGISVYGKDLNTTPILLSSPIYWPLF